MLSSREIAEKHEVPCEILRKVLQRLVQAALIGAHQGPRGGYYLTKKLSEITLGTLADTLLEKNGISRCMEGLCLKPDCSIRENMASFQMMWDEFLHSVTVQDFIENRPREWSIVVSGGKGENHD